MIKLCKKCINPSSRPNSIFDDNGVCIVCSFEEKKELFAVDWEARLDELHGLCQWGKENSKSTYDCIIPISGGKDSAFQLHVLVKSCQIV